MMKFMLIGLLINSVLQSIPMPASEIVEEIEVINRRQEFKNIFEKIEERKLVQEEITEEEIETFENEEIIEEDVPEEMNKQWITFELSAYCPCEYCCDTYDGLVRLDIYCDSHEEALEFGRRVVEGYIVYH